MGEVSMFFGFRTPLDQEGQSNSHPHSKLSQLIFNNNYITNSVNPPAVTLSCNDPIIYILYIIHKNRTAEIRLEVLNKRLK